MSLGVVRGNSASEAVEFTSFDSEGCLDSGATGALGGGPWAVMGCATADLKGDE